MSVDVKPGSTMSMSVPKELFRISLPDGRMWRNYYATTAKGDRLVVESAGGRREPITVMVNWQSRLAAGKQPKLSALPLTGATLRTARR